MVVLCFLLLTLELASMWMAEDVVKTKRERSPTISNLYESCGTESDTVGFVGISFELISMSRISSLEMLPYISVRNATLGYNDETPRNPKSRTDLALSEKLNGRES